MLTSDTLDAIADDCDLKLDDRQIAELRRRLDMNIFRIEELEIDAAVSSNAERLRLLKIIERNAAAQRDAVITLGDFVPAHLAHKQLEANEEILSWARKRRTAIKRGQRPKSAHKIFLKDMMNFYQECGGDPTISWDSIADVYLGNVIDFLILMNACLPEKLKYIGKITHLAYKIRHKDLTGPH